MLSLYSSIQLLSVVFGIFRRFASFISVDPLAMFLEATEPTLMRFSSVLPAKVLFVDFFLGGRVITPWLLKCSAIFLASSSLADWVTSGSIFSMNPIKLRIRDGSFNSVIVSYWFGLLLV